MLWFILVFLLAFAGFTYGAQAPITITLDGKKVTTDTEPIIQNGRTLVPVAVIADNIGGKAVWDGKTREVSVTYKDMGIKLKIDSKDAYVNGEHVLLDVPATIVNERTIVPLAFISTSFGYGVGYDGKSRTVSITTPTNTAIVAVTNTAITGKTKVIEVNAFNYLTGYRVELKGSEPFGEYTTLALTEPNRYVLDVKKADMSVESANNTVFESTISAVRVSQFTTEDARVVVDLKEKSTPIISLSTDKKSMYMDFGVEGATVTGEAVSRGDDERTTPPAVVDGIHAEPFTVVIDPGHGGNDPGALGKEGAKTVLNEKELNLAVSLLVRDKLAAAGINTYMTRETDKAVILASRPAIANGIKAGLFVSIHNNSSESSSSNGMEVMYYNKLSDSLYGMGSSKDIATKVGQHMIKEMGPLGLAFNKYMERPALAVLNKTSMPAILVEGAYLSNTSNREIMKTDAFVEKYATAVADAIIEVVNNR